jgi:hypothetical protein
MTPPFQYQPLDLSGQEIRLVTLAPRLDGSDNCGKVQCKLKNVSLVESPKYEALSYTWGDDTRDNEIILENRSFIVSENLWRALKELSQPIKERVLWIDFICINQDDVSEKNHQVGHMRWIYSSASRVLAWLGEADWFSDSLFTTLNNLEHQERGTEALTCEDIVYIKFWVEHLTGREYWTRLWIVQELALASDVLVVCGSESVEWEILEPWFGVGSLTHRLDVLKKNRRGGSCPLVRLLKDFGDSKCKDPKDLVYGLLGLATDPAIEKIPIDYEKSIYEMYADLMFWANDRDQANIVAFSVQVQTSLDPFYDSDKLRDWHRSDYYRSQIIKMTGKRVWSWRAPYRLEPENKLRLYTVEATIAQTNLNGNQPYILSTAQGGLRLSINEVARHLSGVEVFAGDIIYEFPHCDFSLIVQAEGSSPRHLGRAFIAWPRNDSPLAPFRPTTANEPNPSSASPGVSSPYTRGPFRKADPANTYPISDESDIYPEILIEIDICSFQRLTNQQRRLRRSSCT